MALESLGPLALRFVLAACAADPHGPLDVRQKALLWSKLHQRDWLPTWDMSPIPRATVETWLLTLHGATRAFVADGVADKEAV